MTRVLAGIATDVAVLLIDCGNHGLRMEAVVDNPDHSGIPGFHHIQTHTHECQQHVAAWRLAVGQLPVDEANLPIIKVHLEVTYRQPVINARQHLHDGIAVGFRDILGDPQKQGEILPSGSRHQLEPKRAAVKIDQALDRTVMLLVLYDRITGLGENFIGERGKNVHRVTSEGVSKR